MVEIGLELFPDIAKDNTHGLCLAYAKIPPLPPTSKEFSKDEYEAAR
jgi:hypothetical protein